MSRARSYLMIRVQGCMQLAPDVNVHFTTALDERPPRISSLE